MDTGAGSTVGNVHPLLAEVQRRLDEDVDLASLAERFGYSPFHFHRLFTREVGETPKAHIARLRLEKALLLVAVTGATFLEIALAVGFQNPETFTRAFKRQFGTTPREMRARARGAERHPLDRSGDGYTLSKVRFVSLPATSSRCGTSAPTTSRSRPRTPAKTRTGRPSPPGPRRAA